MEGGRFFFNTVKEGDSILFATDEEAERTLWIQAIYRATGQSHKPQPPVAQQPNKTITNTQLSKMQGGKWPRKILTETDQGTKQMPLSLLFSLRQRVRRVESRT